MEPTIQLVVLLSGISNRNVNAQPKDSPSTKCKRSSRRADGREEVRAIFILRMGNYLVRLEEEREDLEIREWRK